MLAGLIAVIQGALKGEKIPLGPPFKRTYPSCQRRHGGRRVGPLVIFYVQPRSRMMIGKWDLAIKTSEHHKDPLTPARLHL